MRILLSFMCFANFVMAGEPLFTGKLTEVALADTVPDPTWKPRAGMVIDNVDDLSGVNAQEKMSAEVLASQMKPIGAKACGEYFYKVDDQFQKFVTLRIFVFADAEKASAFYKLKYTSELGAQFYNKAEVPVGSSVDSNEISKRIWLIGNVLMTCGELKKKAFTSKCSRRLPGR